jgi:DNA-binding IclR family transcriptional regulator
VTKDSNRDEAPVLRTVERALRLAHVIATAQSGISLSAAAREVRLPTSTAARLLKTLEVCRFAWRDAAGLYHPGSSLLRVGALAVGNLQIYGLAETHLREIADITGETAYLAVAEGKDHALYLRQVESPRAIRHATWAGRAVPISGTAVGSALQGRVGGDGFVTSRATAVEPEAAAAAAPVHDSAGAIVAAVSVIGPSYRITDADLQSFGAAVAEHARALSAELGSRLS